MPEYDREIMNRVYDEICSNCRYKYWEACVGIHTEWGVISCKKAMDRYEKLKNKEE